MSVCEWAEMRARQLNGLSELISQYTSAYRKILEWLDGWEEVSLKRMLFDLFLIVFLSFSFSLDPLYPVINLR
uniref:NR LBD domain-containing protein n=1 Tax=Elaeophora elaphi TaxID=1147741 RepID=A0A0R3RM70_9BILA